MKILRISFLLCAISAVIADRASAYVTFYCRDSSGKTCIEVKSLGDRGDQKEIIDRSKNYGKPKSKNMPASYGVPVATPKPCGSIKL